MAILVHSTTLHRAEKIAAAGPDPNFVESGGTLRAEGFSTCVEDAPLFFGTPEEYARLKAARSPDEGGPAILTVDVPDDIIALATDDVYFPLTQGLVQFDEGAGLEELRAAWPSLTTQVLRLDDA